MVQSRQAEEKIRAILTFPGCWLLEEDETMDTRDGGEQQVESMGQRAELRSYLLSRTVTLLLSLLHSPGRLGGGGAAGHLSSLHKPGSQGVAEQDQTEFKSMDGAREIYLWVHWVKFS